MERKHPLRLYRERNSVSLEAVAEAAETTAATISRIETRKATPSLSLVARLKEVTGLPADEFLPARETVR